MLVSHDWFFGLVLNILHSQCLETFFSFGSVPEVPAGFLPLQPVALSSGIYVAINTPGVRRIPSTGRASLVTIFHVPKDEKIKYPYWAYRRVCKSDDDVYAAEFLHFFIYVSAEPREFDLEACSSFRVYGVNRAECHPWLGEKDCPRPGPYVLGSDGELFQMCQLYEDTHGAFVHSLLPGLRQLHLHGHRLHAPRIAVPCRTAPLIVSAKPLSGLRFAVNDSFQLQGIRTSLCSLAYYELYPPAAQTAECISALCQAGASLVGTTKLASFAATEEPVECIDFQAPWNPRADGYQSSAGSNSGSAAAVAAYEWLDFAVGSDTSGGGRLPGHWNGCIALRPTHGVLSLRGLVPSFPQFDTPTLFARDIALCTRILQAWYVDELPKGIYEKHITIIYPEDYMCMITNPDQQKLIDSIVEDFENDLQTTMKRVSLAQEWSKRPPPDAGDESLSEYMKDASRNSFFYEDYHNFDEFRRDYRSKFGRAPYVSPPVRWQWELSERITAQDHDIAIKRLRVYKEWFLDRFMKSAKRMTIFLIPIENVSPRYRDDPPLPHFDPVSVPNLFLAPVIGGPELTVPIGQVSYESKVSGRTELLPVGLSFLSAPGTDLELIRVVEKFLMATRRPTSVMSGARMF